MRVLKKGPLTPIHQKGKRGFLYFFTCYKKLGYLLKASLIFNLSENLFLRESPFHIVNCLNPFDFTLFFVCTLKLLKGPLWHIFCSILINI